MKAAGFLFLTVLVGALVGCAYLESYPVAYDSTQAGILAPFLLPFTALAGYIAGGSAGRIEGRIYGLPDEQAGDVKALTAKALEQVGIPQQIARGVVERARQSGESVDLLDKAGPATSTDVLDYAGLAPEYCVAWMIFAAPKPLN